MLPKPPIASVVVSKDKVLEADQSFDSICVHCSQSFKSKRQDTTLCMQCFIAGHRGFTCDKYCIVTPAGAALAAEFSKRSEAATANIAITDKATCARCGTLIGQSGSERWFHLRNGLESCGFWATPITQDCASASELSTTLPDLSPASDPENCPKCGRKGNNVGRWFECEPCNWEWGYQADSADVSALAREVAEKIAEFFTLEVYLEDNMRRSHLATRIAAIIAPYIARPESSSTSIDVSEVEVAKQIIETWYEAPDGYRGMMLVEEERNSLASLIASAIRSAKESALIEMRDPLDCLGHALSSLTSQMPNREVKDVWEWFWKLAEIVTLEPTVLDYERGIEIRNKRQAELESAFDAGLEQAAVILETERVDVPPGELLIGATCRSYAAAIRARIGEQKSDENSVNEG